MTPKPNHSYPHSAEWVTPWDRHQVAVRVLSNNEVESFRYSKDKKPIDRIRYGPFESREEAEHFAQVLFDTGAWQ